LSQQYLAAHHGLNCPPDLARYALLVTVQAVIFDWGGTLTPWHTIDEMELWRAICAPHFPDDHHERAAALSEASAGLWRASAADQRSSTIYQVFELARVEPSEGLLASYFAAWEPHTYTDPEAHDVLRYLRARGISTGVLSNTMWPREWHDRVFRRDGVLHLFDAAVYSSEIGRTKPHPAAFRAVMAELGVSDASACVFVGDRPVDDVHGAQRLGMRTVLVPHSAVPPCADARPDAVIHRLSDLPALIESWQA
jgi:putative hydrolase of the HAD superfamily